LLLLGFEAQMEMMTQLLLNTSCQIMSKWWQGDELLKS
jgi:hypothetical protein